MTDKFKNTVKVKVYVFQKKKIQDRTLITAITFYNILTDNEQYNA